MAEDEIGGWRDRKPWETEEKAPAYIVALNMAMTGDDGWYCPHCQHKEYLRDGIGMSNANYFDLIETPSGTEIRCGDCGKEYYLRTHIVRRFFSRKDEKRGEV